MTKPRWWFGLGHEPAWRGGLTRSEEEPDEQVVEILVRQIRGLHDALQSQGRHIERLEVVVEVLLDALAGADVVAEDDLRARVADAVAAVQHAGGALDDEPLVRCERCGEDVPRSDTYITLDGEVCSRCFSGG